MNIENKKLAPKPQITVKQPTAKQPTAKQSPSQDKATTTVMPRPSAVLQRAQKDPSSLSATDVDVLQRTIGLRATQRMLGIPPPVIGWSSFAGTIQAKLTLGPAGDKYEQEADRNAKQVMNSLSASAPTVQRHEQDDEVMQAKPLADGISRIQRAEMEEEDELQAKPLHGLEGGEVDPDVAQSIESAKAGGAHLNDGVRTSMERGFGADFSGVRVHTGGQADALNRSLNARAFTSGNDIFFGQGQYSPDSNAGQELIAHELTHTVQQGAAAVQRGIIQRVTNIQWNTANEAKPSTSGVKGGVFFVKVGATMHVVKAVTDVGATKFAEQLLGMLGGQNIATSNSIPIPQTDNEFAAIMNAIQQLAPVQPQRNNFNTDQDFQEASDKYQTYTTKYNDFLQSPYLLIQQNMFTPGTQVLGVEDLSEAIKEAGNNKGALQGQVDTDVQTQVNLLTNQTLMKAVGRLLAIDTLLGNADRFEEMNVQNAFMRGDNTIGAIDTEAIMQSLTGTKQFATTEIGSGVVPQSGSDVARYVDFVIGSLTTGGGRNISDDVGGTPSSNVARILSEFDSWFEKTFVKKFVSWQDAMVTNKFTQLGFPQDGKNGNWPAVKLTIRAGLDEGVTEIRSAMSGPQKNQIKQNYQNLAGQYGSTDNFDWDAFKVRGEYMSGRAGGMSHEDARQSIIDRMTRRENAKQNVGLSPKVLRVLTFGTTNGLLTAKEEMQIKKLVPRVATANINKILHISNRGGLKKKVQGVVGGDQANTNLNDRLEAARVHQLKNLVTEAEQSGLTPAVKIGISMADRLRSKDVDQVVYRTQAGRLKARSALAMIGVDVNRWGPA